MTHGALELAHDEVNAVERLIMETRIFSALRHLSAVAGQDMLGIEEFQRGRMDDAAEAVRRELAGKSAA